LAGRLLTGVIYAVLKRPEVRPLAVGAVLDRRRQRLN